MSPRRSVGERVSGRALEVMAVVLLTIATLGSAWCAYQATQWNEEQSTQSQRASDLRVEASRLFALATQKVTYDSNWIGMYAEAVSDDKDDLAAFLRESLMRPEFGPKVEQWLADIAAGKAPTNLLSDDEYLAEQLGPYDAKVAEAEAAASEADEAGRIAGEYVLSTLVIAMALFFAGVTMSFRMRSVRLALLVAAAVTLVYAMSRVSGAGVISPF